MPDELAGYRAFEAKSTWLASESLRLEASAYAGGGMHMRERLMSLYDCKRLDKVSDVFVGSRFARTYIYNPESSVPYVTGSDMLLADLKGLLRLSVPRTPQLQDLLIRPRWTLISCSGTIGRAVYVRGEMDGMAASHDVIRAVPDESEIKPGYLFAFLSSRQGQAMIKQRTYGSVVQHIEPHQIADIPVPLPESDFGERIHSLVDGAAKARTEANRLLNDAAAYFDSLAGPMPSAHDHALAIGTAQSGKLDYRLDAFYHIGWATESGQLAGEPIGLRHVTRPGIIQRIFVKRGVPFVSGIDVYQVRVPFRNRLMLAQAERADCILKRGQVLVQRSGQRYGLFGRPAMVSRRIDGWAASEDLIRITTDDESSAARIYAFFYSRAGRRALVRTSYGTSIPHLNPEDVSEVRVPECPSGITASVIRAFGLREQADDDEEQAIREVELWLG